MDSLLLVIVLAVVTQQVYSYNHAMRPLDILISQMSTKLQGQKDVTGFLETLNPSVLRNSAKVGPSCSDALQKINDGFRTQNKDAMHVVDSWGTIDTGILKGSFVFPGRYFDCKEVSNEFYNGKHCTVNIQVDASKTAAIAFDDTMELTIGGCFPDVCTRSEITSLFGKTPGNVTFKIKCPRDLQEYKTHYYTFITVTFILMMLVALASVYDFFTSQEQKDPRCQKSQVSKMILVARCFSLQRNTSSLLSNQQNTDEISCINGIRAVSMIWVIWGHAFLIPIKFADNSLTMMDILTTSWSLQPVINGTFSVDSFFFVSGLLVCYHGLQTVKQKDGKINYLSMLVYRYIRLTPSLGALILIALAGPLLQDGPFWEEKSVFVSDQCRSYWWSNLLYINNLFPAHMPDQCCDWTWYLANDMQFFIVFMLLLPFLHRSPKAGLLFTWTLFLFCVTVTFVLSYMASQQPQVIFRVIKVKQKQLFTEMTDRTENPFRTDIYTKPWSRISTYLVGVMTGFLLHHKNQIHITRLQATIGWILSLIFTYISIFSLKPALEDVRPLHLWTAALYNCLSRPLFGAALAWLTIACSKGHGGILNTFLSNPVFQPLVKLSYATYLLHPMVIWMLLATRETRIHYSTRTISMLFTSSCVWSGILSFMFVMVVEAPAMKLAKIFFNKGSTVKKLE